jgi:hypothetical protein
VYLIFKKEERQILSSIIRKREILKAPDTTKKLKQQNKAHRNEKKNFTFVPFRGLKIFT